MNNRDIHSRKTFVASCTPLLLPFSSKVEVLIKSWMSCRPHKLTGFAGKGTILACAVAENQEDLVSLVAHDNEVMIVYRQ